MKKTKSSPSPHKKRGRGIVFKSLFGISLMLILFAVFISIIGYNGFTSALLDLYSDGAFHTAATADTLIDNDKMDEYAASGGTTPFYMDTWTKLQSLCNSQGVTFIYVIRPDLDDYDHITFLFSTVNDGADYEPYDIGYYRQTTNDEYKEKYRRLYEKESDHELLIRDQGYIETDPHITAMIPLYDSDGKTTAILCVQRQMETLVWVRNSYVGKVLLGLLLLLAIIILIHSFYLSKVCLKPIRTITEEASRFSKDGTLGEQRLSETIKNKDEIGVLATSIDQMEENIIQYVNDLTTITAEKERIVTELTLASKIQADKLPSIFPAFPERTEFDLYASMKPAREIGGDFYDYFLIDEDHLCLVIADVSGKGIPAALFMMSSKITISNFAKMGKSPAEIIMAANEEITETNHEEMFLTVWLGILEISTGKLTAVNAGHEYPAITEADGSFVLYRDKHGFVIGGMSGMRYKEYELNLQPGSKLFVYTDGLPEATNASEEQFGTQRMIEALNEEPDIPPQKILENVNEAVNRFVKDAEQFDDLTMLCLEYKGRLQKTLKSKKDI